MSLVRRSELNACTEACEHRAKRARPVSSAGKPAADPNPRSPLVVWKEHMQKNDFRIVDHLQKSDTENMLSVTVEQFAAALEVRSPWGGRKENRTREAHLFLVHWSWC